MQHAIDEQHKDLAANQASLTAAKASQTNAVAQLKTAVSDLAAKEANQKTVDDDKESTVAEKDAAKFGVTQATTHHANMIAAQTKADAAVKSATDDIADNNDKLKWGKAWLTSNVSDHQVTWMNSRIAGQNDLADADALQKANVAALAAMTTAPAKDAAAWDTKKALLTKQVAGGKTELADTDNLVKWNAFTVDASDLAAATKIQKANAAECAKVTGTAAVKAADKWCMMAKADDAAVKSKTAAADATAAANKKSDAAVKAADSHDGKKNEDAARAELARLRQAEQDAEFAVSQCSGDCTQEKAELATAKAAVTKQTAYLADASNFTHSSDAATAIIIICVSAFVCITGGCIWNHHEKKKAAAKEAEHAKIEAGEAVPTMDAGADAVNFNDDCYTAMVDCEM